MNRIKLVFNKRKLRGMISLTGIDESWTFDLPKNSWVRIGDNKCAWLRSGKKPEDLPMFYLAPKFLKSVKEIDNGLELHFVFNGAELIAEIKLDPVIEEVTFTMRPGYRGNSTVIMGTFPGSLLPMNSRPYPVVYNLAQGMLFMPGKDKFVYTHEAEGRFMFQRWMGGLGEKTSYLCIVENPEDAEFFINYEPGKRFFAGYRHIHSFGTIRYARCLRYRLCADNSYVTLAREFRRYAIAHNFHRSLRDKMKETPSLEKLWGSVLVMLGYIHKPDADYLGALRNLKSKGIKRAFVYPASMPGFFFYGKKTCNGEPAIDIKSLIPAIHKMGYLAGNFFNFTDLAQKCPMISNLAVKPNPGTLKEFKDWQRYILKEVKECLPSWKIGKDIYYRTHYGKALNILDNEFDFSLLDDVHFDVLAATSCVEDYSPDWPMTRTENMKYRYLIHKHYLKKGFIVSGEGQIDCLTPVRHFGTRREFIVPCYDRDARGFGVKAEALRSDLRPVPLWQLVFHDSIFHTSWDHATYNDHATHGAGIPELCMLHDLLYGDMPSIFLEGRIYSYTGGVNSEVINYSVSYKDPLVQKSIPLARRAADWHRQVGLEDMVSHRFLSEDGLVQESAFGNGRRVVVNFSSNVVFLDRGKKISGRSALFF